MTGCHHLPLGVKFQEGEEGFQKLNVAFYFYFGLM